MKKITVVTVSYNSSDETHTLLTSLAKIQQKDFTVSIVVVDNASAKPLTLSEKEKKQDIQLITTQRNLGFTGGYNLGIQKALSSDTEYIVIINNDTTVDTHFLNECLQTENEYNDMALVVPKIYFTKDHEFHRERYKESEKGKVIWYAGGFMDWDNVYSKHRGVDEVDHGQYDIKEQIDFATGCCMFIPRTILERVGLLNNKLFLYFEDADFSKWVLQKGFSIIYEPKAIIWHANASSAGGPGSGLHDYYLTRNRMIFGMTYAPLRTKLALIRESVTLLFSGRLWQKKGIQDFYLRKFGKGSYSV